MPKDLTYIAKTNFRNKEQPFGIKRVDRRQHMYVIGKTGTGKTQFLKNMALQDIENGQGLAIIDPHGEFVEEVLDNIPPHRINDVVYFNPADMEFPVSFNIMDVQDPRYKHLIASGLLGIFTKIWANVWSARMEYILANCILALLDTPGTTLLGIPRMLVDRDYRQKIINNLKDPVVKSFWVNEYEEWEPRYRNEAIAPVQNKVGQFLNVSFVRNIVGQAKSTIDIDLIMNTQKILLVNVSKGRIGEDNSAILGAMIITKIQLSAMERVRIPEDERKDFYMYVDEFQNFATDSFVNILSEARKYRLDLIIAHQYVGQLTTDTSTAVRDAVFGNVGTMISFRVGAADAEFLEQEYMPEFLQNDMIRLANRDIYIKLMINGITSRPFSARTIDIPPFVKDDKKRTEIIKISRSKYAHSVKEVEDGINRWASNLDVPNAVMQGSPDISNPQVDISNPQNFSKPMYKPSNQKPSDQAKLYDVKCSNCGKDTKVIFEPVSGRPVYCKSCLKKLKAGEISPAAPTSSGAAPSPSANRPSIPEREMSNTPAQASVSREDRQSEKGSEGSSALADLGIEFGPASSPNPPKQAKRETSRPESQNRPSSGYRDAPSRPVKPLVVSVREPQVDQKIEPISFNSFNKRQGEQNSSQKPVKRKEINLSELRQALEESLAKKPVKNSTDVDSDKEDSKDKPVEPVTAPKAEPTVATLNIEELSPENIKPEKPKTELQERIEEEQESDKFTPDGESLNVDEEKMAGLQKIKVVEPGPVVNPGDDKKIMKPGEAVKL